ncbi:MAG: hypothetical protein ABIR87_05450 [Sphingomicrobium sp.]
MSKILLAASAAVLAIASPAFADKGGHGGGHGNGGSDHASGGNAGQSMKADRGNGGGKRGGGEMMRQAGNGGQEMKMHGNGGGKEMRQAHAGGGRHERDNAGRDNRGNDRVRVINQDLGDHHDDDRGRFATRRFNDGFGGFANGCPPGLAKKDNGCLPPGQAKKLLGARLQNNFANSLLPYQYRSWYRDDGEHFFRSGDGFIYRVNRSNDLVDGIIPLFSGGDYYGRGDTWPSDYNFYNVPYQYRDYYADTGAYNYRYGDGAIYRLNTGSGVVDSIVALLAGDLGVGQQLPQGYDVYNVPLQYRDRYSDTADNLYRYNDGYIYQVDPKTRLISAVIDAII